jgi:hypothetical protein
MARWAAAAGADGGGVVSVHAIGGMAGIGKTTFAVHAAHRLAGRFPDGQFFLPLHAHTPGQRPVDPADALAGLLLTAGVPAAQIPPGVDARAARWRDCAAGKKILLVLDDAAGHEQVRPLLPGTPGSLVLVTNHRRLAALDDAAVISLDTLPPSEAADLLARLAGRADITIGDAGVARLAAVCGYLQNDRFRMRAFLVTWHCSDLACGGPSHRSVTGFLTDLSFSSAAGCGRPRVLPVAGTRLGPWRSRRAGAVVTGLRGCGRQYALHPAASWPACSPPYRMVYRAAGPDAINPPGAGQSLAKDPSRGAGQVLTSSIARA